MKKVVSMLVFALFVSQGFVFAAEKGTPEYEKMKEYKKAQREARAKVASEPAGNNGPTFWDREGERSGLNQFGPSVSKFIQNLNPVPFIQSQGKKYEERKASATPVK